MRQEGSKSDGKGGERERLCSSGVKLTKEQPRQKRGRRRHGHERATLQEEQLQQQQEYNAEQAATLAGEGQYTRAVQALSSLGMAEVGRETEAELRRLHPPAAKPIGPLPTTEAPQLTFTQMEVLKSVDRFRNGSAPGPSGLRPEHLKAALRSAPNRRDRALHNLTALVNTMMKGKVPSSVAPYLCGARLHAANKKTGGIRPIAVGNLLRRLTSKCAASSLASKAASLLSPHQLGVGVPGGHHSCC